MDKIIHAKVKLNCGLKQAFEMFTQEDKVQSWLAQSANIEPYVGGKYELFWDLENLDANSTIGCKITAIETNKLLCFEWKGPKQFASFMNDADPLTHVSVSFISDLENQNKTEIHLIHTGWRGNGNWEQARVWFENVWEETLNDLRKTFGSVAL